MQKKIMEMPKEKIGAIVLCAGFGTRMQGLTATCPKPMLNVANRPILEHILINLSRSGIQQVAINLHYQSQKITDYFKDGAGWNLHIDYQYEDYPTGTAGGVKALRRFMQNVDRFFVIYGDILSNMPLFPFLQFHLNHGQKASLVVHQNKKSNSFLQVNSVGKVERFIERPQRPLCDEKGKALNHENMFSNSGIYLFEKSIWPILDSMAQTNLDFPRDIFPGLVTQGELWAYPLPKECQRWAIDTPERLKEANEKWSSIE